jgi:hypothetical protein
VTEYEAVYIGWPFVFVIISVLLHVGESRINKEIAEVQKAVKEYDERMKDAQ